MLHGRNIIVGVQSDPMELYNSPFNTLDPSVMVAVSPNAGDDWINVATFSYQPIPTISSIHPTSGPISGQQRIRVDGTGFEPTAELVCEFDSIRCRVCEFNYDLLYSTGPRSNERHVCTCIIESTRVFRWESCVYVCDGSTNTHDRSIFWIDGWIDSRNTFRTGEIAPILELSDTIATCVTPRH